MLGCDLGGDSEAGCVQRGAYLPARAEEEAIADTRTTTSSVLRAFPGRPGGAAVPWPCLLLSWTLHVPSTFPGLDRRTAPTGGGCSHGMAEDTGRGHPAPQSRLGGAPGRGTRDEGRRLGLQQAGARAGPGTVPLRAHPACSLLVGGFRVFLFLLKGKRGVLFATFGTSEVFIKLMFMFPVAFSSHCGFTWHRFQD